MLAGKARGGGGGSCQKEVETGDRRPGERGDTKIYVCAGELFYDVS